MDGMSVLCEAAMNGNTIEQLRSMGHQITVEDADLSFGFGGAQLIHRLDSNGYAGGSDPRKDGGAYGF